MNVLTLERLTIENFKGIRSFELNADGKDLVISGDNGTGKTTIADACSWLFTNKDTKGKADFALKPLDAENNEIHNLETVVEGLFTFNGKPITLKKLYKENYTQKKGSLKSEFSGHVKEHWIDEVPKKQGEYQAAIKNMFDEEIYSMVSDPMFFAEMPWQRRREILLEMSGDITDLEVIESEPELAPLAELIKEKNLDEIRAMAKSSMRKINKEIEGIPPRISELKNQMDAVKPEDKELARLEKQLQDAKDKLTSLQNNEETAKLRERIAEIEAEIATIKAEAAKACLGNQKPILEKIKVFQGELSGLNQSMADCETQIKTAEKRIKITTEAMDNLRNKWHAENKAQATIKDTCPTCGQSLPEDQIQEATKKFNNAKAEKLKKIDQEGKGLKESAGTHVKEIELAKEKLAQIEARIEVVNGEIFALEQSLESPAGPPDTRQLEFEKAEIKGLIEASKSGTAIQERDLKEKIEQIQKQINDWNKQQAQYDAAEKARQRIDELLAQEKTLAEKYEQLQHQVDLTDRFVVQKVKLLEGNINNSFALAKFKLYKDLINGGIDDKCCEVLCGGVPFTSGLNTAARVNVGLDICQTLSKYYGLQATIWIDNKESVNDLIPIQAQVISMSVSKDEELTIDKAEVDKAS